MSLVAYISFVGFTLCLAGLVFNQAYLLSALLCLEGMMLSLYLNLSFWALDLPHANFSFAPLLLLAFSACEASVGLALLVAASRTHSTTQVRALNLLQC